MRKSDPLHCLYFACRTLKGRQGQLRDFFIRAVGLYNNQEGRCSVTGQPLRLYGEPRGLTMAIGKVYRDGDATPDNLQLTIQWVRDVYHRNVSTKTIFEMAPFLCVDKVKANMDVLMTEHRLPLRILNSKDFVFEPLDLTSEEGQKLLNKEYNLKEVKVNVRKSMLHFLYYSCTQSIYSSRQQEGFFEHIVDLYNRQKGRCAVTNQVLCRPMEGSDNDTRFFGSIDRLGTSRSYEIGHVQLTTRWVNNALGYAVSFDNMFDIATLLCYERLHNNVE